MTEKQELSAHFQRGQQASRDRNFLYAHQLFSHCVSRAPGNLLYAETLFSNIKSAFGKEHKQVKHLLAPKGTKEFKKAIADKDWLAVIHLGVTLLGSEPWNVLTLRGLAKACEGLHHYEVELVYLKQALDAAPRDVEVNRHCARSLARMGQFDQAIACWHRLEEIRGEDAEAAQMVLRLTQEKMQHPGGRPPQAAKVPVTTQASPVAPKSEERSEVPAKSDPLEVIPETTRQRLERLVQADPTNASHYLALVEHLCETKHFDDVERLLGKARHHCDLTEIAAHAWPDLDACRAAFQAEREADGRKSALMRNKNHVHFPWLEFLLLAAGLALVFQIMPNWWAAVYANLQLVLFVVNLLLVVGLVAWQVRTRNST